MLLKFARLKENLNERISRALLDNQSHDSQSQAVNYAPDMLFLATETYVWSRRRLRIVEPPESRVLMLASTLMEGRCIKWLCFFYFQLLTTFRELGVSLKLSEQQPFTKPNQFGSEELNKSLYAISRTSVFSVKNKSKPFLEVFLSLIGHWASVDLVPRNSRPPSRQDRERRLTIRRTV